MEGQLDTQQDDENGRTTGHWTRRQVEEFWTGVRPCPRRRRHQDSRASTPGDGTPWAPTSTLQYTGHEARRIGLGANTGVLVGEFFWIRLL